MSERIDYGSDNSIQKGDKDDQKEGDKEMMKSNIIVLKVLFSTGVSGERVAE